MSARRNSVAHMSLDFHQARALLEWQVELGADEAIGETPVNRYDLPGAAPKPAAGERPPEEKRKAMQAPPVVAEVDPVEVSRRMAAAARDLDGLRDALADYSHCDLKLGARNLVFSDGNPAARVMIVGEAPGRDEDIQGKPFVGRAGQFLNRMLAAIDMARDETETDKAVYITNVLPWRPPHNRDPSTEEIAMLMPFVARHIELIGPKVIVPMGNISCLALLGKKGITRLRGDWTQALNLPALPMFHPAYLLRNPAAKREAWHDLLSLQARLRDGV